MKRSRNRLWMALGVAAGCWVSSVAMGVTVSSDEAAPVPGPGRDIKMGDMPRLGIPPPEAPRTSLPPELAEMKRVAETNNRFGLALYGQFAAPDVNVFFSPYSVASAVGMVMQGAKGNTESQIAATLQLPKVEGVADLGWVAPGFGELNRHINAGQAGAKPPYELAVANALWGQKGESFQKPFLDVLNEKFKAPLREMGFDANPEAARLEINRWVEINTRDRIKDLIPQGTIDEATRLVLTNAIYFKGKWSHEFDPKMSQPMDFVSIPSIKPSKPVMMHRTGDYRMAEVGDVKVIDLPYMGDKLSMVVMLPKANGIREFEKKLDETMLNTILGTIDKTRMREVRVFFPKFKMTLTPELTPALKQLGMSDAFAPGVADFSGINGKRDLYISAAIHKAFVEVNEEGTEAAAATALVMRATAMPMEPLEFKADRPFVFVIRDRATNAVLFMGRLLDPSRAQ